MNKREEYKKEIKDNDIIKHRDTCLDGIYCPLRNECLKGFHEDCKHHYRNLKNRDKVSPEERGRFQAFLTKAINKLNSELEQLIEAKKQALKEGRTDNYETLYTMEAEQIGKITALEEVLIVEG